MKPGSWPSILLVYLYGVLASASLSKLIPLSEVLIGQLDIGPAQFALLLSLITLPAAIVGAAVGGLVDRIGPSQALIFSAIAGALANIAYLFAEHIVAFELIRIFEGFALVGIFAAAPALIMATTVDKRRVRAMALWATYTPVGFSTGLLLAGAFVATDHWRICFVIHAILFISIASMGLVLPNIEQPVAIFRPHTLLSRLKELLSGYSDPMLVRLVLALGCVVSIGFGTSTVFPTWFAHEHSLPIGTAAGVLAVANLAMIGGSLLAGALIAKGLRVRTLFAMLAAVGIASGSSLWFPLTPMLLALALLGVWLATTGAATATVMAVLPTVVRNPQKGASAAGLISQTSALVAFLTPPIWIPIAAGDHWTLLIALVMVGWLASLALLPVWGERAAPAPLVS
ncbi:MAG TPA: MFS transporter [Steroidobacteraceae bacterium]|jgi:MFS family permease|nr:MFS transporter [Steroidobacteraceae bacterium]